MGVVEKTYIKNKISTQGQAIAKTEGLHLQTQLAFMIFRTKNRRENPLSQLVNRQPRRVENNRCQAAKL